MAVHVVLPAYLQPLAGGRDTVALEPAPETLDEAMRALRRLHPGAYDRVINELGEVRPHVNLFVGQRHSRELGGLTAALHEGDEVIILPAVSGG